MLWSKLFIPTLREMPAEAETPGHQLLARAGYIRQAGAGLHVYLYLAQRSLEKIQRIVRSEMNAIGAQEFLFPVLNPADSIEDLITSIARRELRSYKQLPQIWYRIQIRFRSDALRVRQFIMSDSCSFDIDAEALNAAFQKHHAAYGRIFARCGLTVTPATGNHSAAFIVPFEAGEDSIIACAACGYSATLDHAVSKPAALTVPDPDTNAAPEEFHTPERKTILDVSEFVGLPPASQMKSLVMVADGKPVLALVRGDHHLSRAKLGALLDSVEVRPANSDEIREWFGADPGSLGPLGVSTMQILADDALKGRRNMIVGANKNDYHLRNVTPGRDFIPEYADLRQVDPGDACVSCGAALKLQGAIEVGRLSQARQRLASGIRVLSPNGGETPVFMGSYELGIDRVLTSSAEQHRDEAGMFLPPSIAPFSVIVTPVNNADAATRGAAQTIYDNCLAMGIDALYDDRDERPGVKFKDADLIGVPYRITIGKKLGQGIVELTHRKTRTSRDVELTQVISGLKNELE